MQLKQAFVEEQNIITGWFGEARDSITTEKVYYRLGRAVVDLYARAMLKMDVEWRAPLPDGPKILAANHPTTTDPFLIMLLTSEQVSVLVTEGCFEVLVFGRILRGSGHVPVVRNSGGRTVREAIRLLRDGRTVAIFPEGALSPLGGGGGPGFCRPHTGVARVALSARVPVIPVGIHVQHGHIRVAKTSLKGEPVIARWYVGGPYAVTVGEPIAFGGDVADRARVRAVSEQIMERIVRLAGESTQRVSAPGALETKLLPRPASPSRLSGAPGICPSARI
jgi:1-acyl-sn-glycerol-3-phosphate acyltransferase